MYFVWKIENFDELQLPQSSIFFGKSLHDSFLTMSANGIFFTFDEIFRY